MIFVLGIVIGLVLGLTGAGGSVFAVPLLVNVLDLPLQQAAGLSLGAVATSALVGVIIRFKQAQIQWLPAMVFAFIGSLGAPLGTWLNRLIDERSLFIGFAVLVFFIALNMWRQASRTPAATKIVRAQISENTSESNIACSFNPSGSYRISIPCILGMGIAAFTTGTLSGLFGVGGGFLIVPALLYLTSMSIQQAVATSLVVIAIIGSVGFSSFLMSGNDVSLSILSILVVGGILGMGAGIYSSRWIAGPVLQKLFSVMMMLIILVTFYTSY